jgi:hypothetical protein
MLNTIFKDIAEEEGADLEIIDEVFDYRWIYRPTFSL